MKNKSIKNFLLSEVGEYVMAKGKYHEWITPEGLLLIEGWARDGLTDEQIAEKIGIGTTTLYRWKNEHREIRETLKKGKEVVDRQVENSLLKNALGYEYEEQTVTNKGDIVTITRYQHPNTAAQIFWLKNRMKVWRLEASAKIDKTKAETEYIREKTKLLRDAAEGNLDLVDEWVKAVLDDG